MMAQMILADAATAHPDGTISMLRAWINQVWGAAAPFPFRGALAIRIQGEIGDQGKHSFDLKCLDLDGQEVLPKLQGEFEVPKGGGAASFVLNIQAAFQKPAKYVFVLRVDRVQLQEWQIGVLQRPSAPPSG